jgi:hypothetical protein
LTLVEQFAEHFHAGASGLQGWLQTNDFDFFADLDDAALDTTCNNRTATGDGEYVFHWHQEGAVQSTFWLWDVSVQCFCQTEDRWLTQVALVAFNCLQC